MGDTSFPIPNHELQYYESRLNRLAENWDQFISERVLKQPNIWHDRIPRGSYPLFQGLSQKTNIFRGSRGAAPGLANWRQVGLSRKPVSQADAGFDNCAPMAPERYNIAWETVSFNGYENAWTSEPFCVRDLKFVDYAKEQLALIIRSGVEYGVSMLENWNREIYMYQATLGGHAFVMCEGALDYFDNTAFQFDYDPFSNYSESNVEITHDGEPFTFVKFRADLNISTLNWTYLDYIRQSLAERAGGAAIGSNSGMPLFGLMIDMQDFERMVYRDVDLREDFRFAQPQSLIEGYNFGLKQYRGFALMHDGRQARFKVYKTVDTGGVEYIIARRVRPDRDGREVTFGHIPEPNPEYYQAELGVGVIFMNDVVIDLFEPTVNSLGGGTVFGPAPGYNGKWEWVNVKDPVSNPFGEIGNFYGRYAIWPKTLPYASETTIFLYRRCPQAIKTVCAVQEQDDVGTGAVAMASVPAATDFDATRRIVTLTLVSKLDATIGDAVTINTDDGDDLAAIIAEDALAPTYTFAWESGASNAPSAVTELNDPAIVTVTVV